MRFLPAVLSVRSSLQTRHPALESKFCNRRRRLRCNAQKYPARRAVRYLQSSGDGYKTLIQGQDVEFEVTNGPKGPQAENVLKVE